MAKTESTAVNDLIDLVQSGQAKPVHDPDADLFATPKSNPIATPRKSRMTSPVPALRGAGEVEPLPRGRAPHSTSQHAMSQQAAPMLPVRMSTAEPSSGNTIPPLAAPPSRAASPSPRAAAPALPPPRQTPRATSPVPAVRTTGSQAALRPSAPPPRPSQRLTPASPPVPQRASSPRPSALSRPTVPTLPPPTAPVAAPFEARGDASFSPPAAIPQQFPIIGRAQTVDATGDVIRADNWFELSAAVHKVEDGTHVVPRPSRDTLALAKKMVVPTIILAIVGIMIGGFFAFDGDGGAQAKRTVSAPPAAVVSAGAAKETRVAMTATASDETRVEMTAAPTAAAPSTESPNAATASAGGAQPEPPTKEEELAKQQAAAAVEAAQPAPATGGSMLPAATTAALAPPAAAPAAPAAAAPAPAAAAAPAPAAAAAPAKAVTTSPAAAQVHEVKTPHGVLKLVDVRIDSKPSGATVMLVDGGKTSFLGSTPLATSLDASRKYDVIFTLPGRPTQMAALDPATMSRLDVTLGRAHHGSSSSSSTSATSAKKAAKLDSFIDKSEVAKTADKPSGEPKADKAIAKADKAVAKASDDKAGGEGTLMVSSKPPCEILIDGKATGLTTPQRAIALPAGAHKVTFVNSGAGINKTVSVTITADKSTKLIQDLMAK